MTLQCTDSLFKYHCVHFVFVKISDVLYALSNSTDLHFCVWTRPMAKTGADFVNVGETF